MGTTLSSRRTLWLTIPWTAVALIHIYPIFLILISSVKTKAELALNPTGLPQAPTLANFAEAFRAMNYFRSTINTALLASISVGALVLFGAMGAYAIARRSARFYRFMYMFFIAGLIVPFQMRMVPLYGMMLNLGLINTYAGMIFVYIASFAPFSVFLITGFVKTVPISLEESALIEGCNPYQTFFLIVMPLLKPILATVAVLNMFHVWNDFIMALIFLQRRAMMTLTVSLSAFQGLYFNDWSLILAGICMIVLPVLLVYLSAQRFIINGITAGAIKG